MTAPIVPPRALVEVTGIRVAFGGVVAVDDASVTVREGELVGLIGPNGAGKTSLLNAISGVVPLAAGRLVFDGRDITRVPLHARVGTGIARTFQGVELFPSLNTVDNLMIGRHHLMRANAITGGLFYGRARREEIAHRRRVEEIIDFLELERYRTLPVGVLPFGVQKLVGLGRAMAAEPRLLLLDEPASGLNHEERRDLARFMLRIKHDLGTTMVWVEHDVRMVRDLADRVVALRDGRKVGEGTPAEVLELEEVRRSFLGASDEIAEVVEHADGAADQGPDDRLDAVPVTRKGEPTR
jgi:branched-chain amino acid transport system ATP-binding protein